MPYSINETMGQYSELFMLLAAGTYTVAFIAFAWDLAKSSKTLRAVDLKAAELSGAAPARVPVGAGVGASAAGVDRADADVAGPVGRAERPTSSVSGSQANGAGVTADGGMRYGAERRVPARVAVALAVLGAAIHAAGVITRAIGAGRVPWGNMYEFLTTGAFVAVAVFLLVLIRRDLRFLGTFVIGLAIIMLVAASIAFWTPVGHLVPALQSYWLIIHVSIAVLSSALFTLTFAMSALQLVQSHRQKTIAAGGADKLGFMRLVPNALSLENLSYRINAIAFVGWTFTLMFGAIWAEKAWGRFWGWDTKEVWTFVIWVVYAGYLHARATRGWTGTRAAWLSIVGYLCVVFNFTIVNQFFNGLHSYSGL
ncbi:c-type cytochrome biogenesis protein CcsB [uncultured Arthrobacter sp.]|uniref:c-type cytochrome biogenesis protein CcsB n=1 Tax=uncultured Arthrobacter sp. TaxID=114050 RepID=UPI0032169A3D